MPTRTHRLCESTLQSSSLTCAVSDRVASTGDDPDRLLLLGDDGRYYAYHLPNGAALPTEPEEGEWAVDPAPPPAEDLFA